MSLAAITTLLSLAGSIYGNEQSKQATEEQNQLLNNRIDDLDNWYNAESNKNYLDTAESKAAISNLKAQMDKAMASQANGAVKTGATAESKVAMQGELQEKYANAISNLAGYNTQKKDNVRREYNLSMNNLLNQKNNMIASDQENWSNFANNIVSALGSVNQAYGEGAFDDWFGTSSYNTKDYVAGSGNGMYSNRGF